MDSYIFNNIIIIPIQISFNTETKKKNINFPKEWSNIQTIEQSNELFEKYNTFKEIALLTGKINNITVIDVDNIDKWNELKIEYPLSKGIVVETNKGFHLYYKYNDKLKTRSNIIDGIDIRNDGGNVIIPPSAYQIDNQKIEYCFNNCNIESFHERLLNLPDIPSELLQKFENEVKPKTIRIELSTDQKIYKLNKLLSKVSPIYYNNYGNIKNLAYGIVNYSSKINLPMKNLFFTYAKKGNVYEDEINKIWEDTEINNSVGYNFLVNIVRNYKLNYLETDSFDQDVLIGLLSKKKDLIIDYLNRHFAVITSNDNGKILYCELEYKKNKLSNIILIPSKENFINKIPNSIQIEYKEDKYKSISNYWIESRERNEFRKTIFEPGIESFQNLNMFLGFNYIFDEKFKYNEEKLYYVFKHIREILCDNNEETFNYLLNWMAHILQYPTKRMGVAIVCKSIQGVGKNIFFENFFGSMVIGLKHSICISDTDQVVGKFNSILERMLYTVVNELKADGDIIKMSNLLKSLITDSTQKIEKKGIDAIHINNYNNFVFLSNNHNVVNVEMFDRRYLCLAASSKYANNQSYFNKLCKNMLNEEISMIFFHYLMKRDLKKFNFRNIPLTQYKKDLIYNSIPSVMKWFNEYLKDCLNENIEEKCEKVKLLCEQYKEYSQIGRINYGNFTRQLIDIDKGLTNIKIDNSSRKNNTYLVFNVQDCIQEMKEKSMWYNF